MKVTQIAIGRFHHFHLARQLEKHELLDKIYTGYPRFKLKDEEGIAPGKIKTFPWLQAPFMKRGLVGLDKIKWLNEEWIWSIVQTFDNFVSMNIKEPGILFALSCNGLKSGAKMQSIGGKYICDRGSSHISYQNEILADEYSHWGLQFKGIDQRIIDKEKKEYAQANYITVPSEFVKLSFIEKGVDPKKIIKIPYGARLDRFYKQGEAPKDKFRVLWVGGINIRKGFLYALEAFQKIKHPQKKFVVIGAIEPQIKNILAQYNLNQVEFKGQIPNIQLLHYYSTSHAFILPSLEEGLAMVQGEALACGCPVIASSNTGAADLFTDEQEGFIVPIRSVDALTEKLQLLADQPALQKSMSAKALIRTQQLNGWDTYGQQMVTFLNNII
jgi:glycosyltransferase involved in cell wall biosynthesis